MSSRMNKYYEEEEVTTSRYKKNEELYIKINKVSKGKYFLWHTRTFLKFSSVLENL